MKKEELKLGEIITRKQERFKSLIYTIFVHSPDGRELLNLMKEIYLQQPCSHPDRPDWFAYFRDGENHVIRTILQICEYKNQPK